MKNFTGLKAEIKKQKAIRARFDNERGRQTLNWNAWRPFSVRAAHTLGKRKTKSPAAPGFSFGAIL
ncbi:hypothetical protein [Phascolarctobacterium succinatutens]|jgi:hypothetical protein|uniref:hypothetical protein n=1 Tax=Phascolarctobacterium succinatutens TaxID=626940 RepID=UPI003FD7A04B